MPAIVPSLWFDNCAEEAAHVYASVFPNSSVDRIMRYTEAGPGTPGEVVTVEFQLDGTHFVGINGGPMFQFSEAVSFEIRCADQAEIDYYWDALVEGGQEQQCGWLKDRYGLSWQVTTGRLYDLLNDGDPRRAAAVTKAMLGMRKLVLADLEAAADSV